MSLSQSSSTYSGVLVILHATNPVIIHSRYPSHSPRTQVCSSSSTCSSLSSSSSTSLTLSSFSVAIPFVFHVLRCISHPPRLYPCHLPRHQFCHHSQSLSQPFAMYSGGLVIFYITNPVIFHVTAPVMFPSHFYSHFPSHLPRTPMCTSLCFLSTMSLTSFQRPSQTSCVGCICVVSIGFAHRLHCSSHTPSATASLSHMVGYIEPTVTKCVSTSSASSLNQSFRCSESVSATHHGACLLNILGFPSLFPFITAFS